jgi:excinuclease ABC subunit A
MYFRAFIKDGLLKKYIHINGASENNLKNIDLEIEHNKITVVTGVSGSGKSSLVHDIICKESQRRYLESFSSYARQYLKQVKRPDVNKISGLPPAISVDQKTTVRNPRSTVGTMSELYDYLRLLFARIGKADKKIEKKIERRLFSFNSPYGACPKCNGLGVEDKIDPQKLISDDSLSLRQGALIITTPSGYTVYSQVTIDVMDQICKTHGFNVDTPWKNLKKEDKNVILYGTDKIKVLFGKHSLESRMKWSGITAKPREEGYYKGIIPVMEEILKRDRNKNILRFVQSVICSACGGKRLNDEALKVKIQGYSIADLSGFTTQELYAFFEKIEFEKAEKAVGESIRKDILKRTKLLIDLGLAYLTLSRESTTLSGGEAQRIRLANQAATKLRNVLYVLDEPSIGLHPHDTKKLLSVLNTIAEGGNTVLLVEHDDNVIKFADQIIDIGPKAGKQGGELIYSGPLESFLNGDISGSLTHQYLTGQKPAYYHDKKRLASNHSIQIIGASHNNLQNIDVTIPLGQLTVVTGVSGAGKSSLIHDILANKLKTELHGAKNLKIGAHSEILGTEQISKIIEIDQSPIGRTPRSNPATYTKLFDHIRDLFAALPESKEKGWKKGRFSFNNKGGRCETCQGAGSIQIGMHFMGNVDIICSECKGKRFNNETLSIEYKGKNIYDVLEMSIDEACDFFKEQAKPMQFLSTLQALGLGYLTLGQQATTLSGGEAQRIKLAAELSKQAKAHTIYILDEPTTGLHMYDVDILLRSLHALVDSGQSVIIIEHHADIIRSADHIIDLGPGSEDDGGTIVAQGSLEDIKNCNDSITGKELLQGFSGIQKKGQSYDSSDPILFKGVSTHNLKNIDVEIPIGKMTVLTGVSGSGKSSLAFDTIFAEGRKRYTESFSSYVRTLLKQKGDAEFESVSGIIPAIAVDQRSKTTNPRSTLGTMTEIYDLYRLIFARFGEWKGSNNTAKPTLYASDFSFNHEDGACPECKGLGYAIVCDPQKLISHPGKSLLEGAMDGSKTGKFYGDPFGQYTATLEAVGKQKRY